ncbi:MAG TPA: hypothetical protein VF938_04325 [Candidatus Angelobacter sp.]
MLVINGFTRFGMVEGLGDEEIPWWLAPYVRDAAALARSSAVLEAKNNAAAERLARRISEIAGVARVAAHMRGNEGFASGVNSALTAEIDEFCGTPPRPHHLNQAALAVALIASSLEANDPAKAALVAQADRLQGLKGQQSVATAA